LVAFGLKQLGLSGSSLPESYAEDSGVKKSLPKLVITSESHPKLYRFLRHHPEILVVFHNVEKDRPLDQGVILASGDSKEIVKVYIDHLHLPLLIEHKVIGKNVSRACGYEPLVAGLEYLGYDSLYGAQVAADRAMALSKVAKPTDTKENSLYCYYHGSGESILASQTLLNQIRAVVLQHAQNPGEAKGTDEGMSFDLVVTARVSQH
jgi:hypothetical protein